MWANFHMHSEYCDGVGTLQDYIAAAKANQVTTLGFSSHAPVPFHCEWCMKKERLKSYLAEIESLAKAHNDIEIYKGLEIDFIPETISPADFKKQLDFTIGSIHFIDQFEDGKNWEVDGNHVLFMNGLQKIFNNDIREAIKRYFELTRQMVELSHPDIVGHLDKIKIQNEHSSLFSESDHWYQEEITHTLNVIANAGSIIEVNTRGIYQKKSVTTYPSPWILEMIRMRNIPITINSDAHHPKDLINQFNETAHLLYTLGFRKICILRDGSWQPVNLTPDGFN
jgi:histidinol-phosphatase (PHP family)